jgi:hypothetical protein
VLAGEEDVKKGERCSLASTRQRPQSLLPQSLREYFCYKIFQFKYFE